MEFQNTPVDPDSLPALEEVALSPVSAWYAPYRLLSTLVRWLPLALLLWAMPFGGNLPPGIRNPAAVVLVVAALGLAVFSWFEARRRAFGLREHDLIYRSGLLVRRTTVLPLARIQHVETLSGPLERGFGLVRLTCFTAGGVSADLVIQGLQRDAAERVRQYLLARIQERDTGTPVEAHV